MNRGGKITTRSGCVMHERDYRSVTRHATSLCSNATLDPVSVLLPAREVARLCKLSKRSSSIDRVKGAKVSAEFKSYGISSMATSDSLSSNSPSNPSLSFDRADGLSSALRSMSSSSSLIASSNLLAQSLSSQSSLSVSLSESVPVSSSTTAVSHIRRRKRKFDQRPESTQQAQSSGMDAPDHTYVRCSNGLFPNPFSLTDEVNSFSSTPAYASCIFNGNESTTSSTVKNERVRSTYNRRSPKDYFTFVVSMSHGHDDCMHSTTFQHVCRCHGFRNRL